MLLKHWVIYHMSGVPFSSQVEVQERYYQVQAVSVLVFLVWVSQLWLNYSQLLHHQTFFSLWIVWSCGVDPSWLLCCWDWQTREKLTLELSVNVVPVMCSRLVVCQPLKLKHTPSNVLTSKPSRNIYKTVAGSELWSSFGTPSNLICNYTWCAPNFVFYFQKFQFFNASSRTNWDCNYAFSCQLLDKQATMIRQEVLYPLIIGPAVRADFQCLYPANAKTPTCCPSDDNRTKVTNSVTSARSLWWHVGPYFSPADLTWTANPIYCLISTHRSCTLAMDSHPISQDSPCLSVLSVMSYMLPLLQKSNFSLSVLSPLLLVYYKLSHYHWVTDWLLPICEKECVVMGDISIVNSSKVDLFKALA